MKTEEMIALAIGGIALWMMFVSRKVAAAPASPSQIPAGGLFSSLLSPQPAGYVTEITNTADPGEPGWAWRYYSDGTVIDPTGAYYYQGQKVYG